MAAGREQELREALVRAGRRLYQRGLVAGTEGNLSVRLDVESILITPSGLVKGDLEPSDLIRANASTGQPLVEPGGPAVAEDIAPARQFLPSSEIGMHLALYDRADVAAVVHAHPPYATAIAAAGQSLEPPILAEQPLLLGEVPVLPFALPSTAEVADAVSDLPATCRAFLLAHHGATTVGGHIEEAIVRMEVLESCARATWLSRTLNPEARLSDEQVAALRKLRDHDAT
jgi:L-fuculose-phosphate aldolase